MDLPNSGSEQWAYFVAALSYLYLWVNFQKLSHQFSYILDDLWPEFDFSPSCVSGWEQPDCVS